MDQEKRTAARFTVPVPAKLRYGNTNRADDVLCRNISLGGTCLLSKEHILPQSRCSITFLTPNVQPLTIVTEVVWQSNHRQIYDDAEGYAIGMRFLPNNGCQSSDIETFLNTLVISQRPEVYKQPQSTELAQTGRWQFPDTQFEFDSFAKKASAIIKDGNKNIRLQVEDFFNKDVRQYHEDLSALVHEMANGKIESEEIEKRLTILTNDLLLKGNALEKIVDNRGMKKIKQLFRELTGYWFYQSPIMKMGYEKPRGYPGDYELFEIIYNGKPIAEEKTIGFYFDKYFLNNGYTNAVRTRKNKMKNILQDLIETNNSSRLRLLNVACGPCREMRELLSDPLLASRANVCFTGLDNDEGSLKFSKSALDQLPPNNITLRFLKENVLSLFRDNKHYDIIGKQDVIYILGLTEYLPDRVFKKLISFLSQLLDDKGMLVITYKDKDIPFPSLPPDWLCDWAFIKRSKDDLISAAEGLGLEKYSLRIEKEGTGTIFFLILTKT